VQEGADAAGRTAPVVPFGGDASLARLGIDYVDLYQIHCPNTPGGVGRARAGWVGGQVRK
jgi:aryl-alcohol dehydrogenase-like predicted oxidoreductase